MMNKKVKKKRNYKQENSYVHICIYYYGKQIAMNYTSLKTNPNKLNAHLELYFS